MPPQEEDAHEIGLPDEAHGVPPEEKPQVFEERVSGRARKRAGYFLYNYAVVIVFVAVVGLFSLLMPDTYATYGNFRTILASQSVLLMLALALTIPLVVGEFDLSIGSLMGFASILLTYLVGQQGFGSLTGVAISLGVGAVVGFVNGFFVVRVGVGAFITTLATGTILSGLTLAVSNGQILGGVPSTITDFVTYKIFDFPVPVYISFALAAILWYVLDHTPLGRYLYFVGAGSDTARLTGLPVDVLRWGAFVAAGVISSAAGVISAGELGGAVTGVGESYLLPAFAAAFLGATTIKPGRFNAWGTLLALYLVVAAVTGLQLMGASSWVEQVFNGAALLIALTFARFVARGGADA